MLDILVRRLLHVRYFIENRGLFLERLDILMRILSLTTEVIVWHQDSGRKEGILATHHCPNGLLEVLSTASGSLTKGRLVIES